MKYIKTYEAYSDNSLEILKGLNTYVTKYNLPEFKISGNEKSGKWYKDIFNTGIYYSFRVDDRKPMNPNGDKDDTYGWTFYFSVSEGRKSNYFVYYSSSYTRQLVGGYDTQKIDEKGQQFDDLESCVQWISDLYINRPTKNPYLFN